jgi:glutaredoxin 3
MAVGTDTVTVYTTSTCPWCVRAKEYLKQKGVPFRERNIEFDRAAAQEVAQRSGQRGVPVIIAGDDVIVGFDRPRLDALASRFAPPPPAADAAPRPKIGLRVKDATGGAEVGGVRSGSPSERAGLREGDVVIEMNGKPVRSAADLEAVLASLTVDTTVAVQVRRNGKQTRLRMAL